jgi:hypothetical protein
VLDSQVLAIVLYPGIRIYIVTVLETNATRPSVNLLVLASHSRLPNDVRVTILNPRNLLTAYPTSSFLAHTHNPTLKLTMLDLSVQIQDTAQFFEADCSPGSPIFMTLEPPSLSEDTMKLWTSPENNDGGVGVTAGCMLQ